MSGSFSAVLSRMPIAGSATPTTCTRDSLVTGTQGRGGGRESKQTKGHLNEAWSLIYTQ